MLKTVSALLVGSTLMFNAVADDVADHARSATWRRLVHYEADFLDSATVKSAIHSREFFLAENGATDPEAELRATLAAMQEPVLQDSDTHAKCRFPARRIWLQKTFRELHSLGPIPCPALAEWMPVNEVDSISLMFANGYLGNPASYYGHIFLKINSKKGGGRLVDQTLNYGAIETGNDDPVSYIVKGVSGGYDGGFSPVDFFFHDANYGENELRDLWEYRLNLPPADALFIVSHAWEVMHKRYVYYFFHDNCAYRVAELLEVVQGIVANPKHRPWVVPQAVLQQVSAGTYRGEPLLSRKIYHPSRQTRLYQRFVSLNPEQKDVVSRVIDQQVRIDGPEMKAMPLADQHAVIDTLLDYHRFRKDGEKQNAGRKMSAGYVDALSARFSLPPGEAAKPVLSAESPDSGKSPSWVQLGATHHQTRGDAISLRLRPAYYDPLDVSNAQAKHGGLSMGDLQVDIANAHLRLHHFDIVAINSMNPAITGLPGDRGVGWKLRAGLEQERLGCKDCLASRIQADYSRGGLLGSPAWFGAVHVGGAIQGSSNYDGYGFARAGASVVFRPSSNFGLLLTHELRRPIDTSYAPYAVSSAEVRVALGKSNDLRARWEQDKTSALTIGIGAYW